MWDDPEWYQWYLDALHEVDDMCPGSAPVAPRRATEAERRQAYEAQNAAIAALSAAQSAQSAQLCNSQGISQAASMLGGYYSGLTGWRN